MTANQLAYDTAVDRAITVDAYEKGILKKLDATIDQHFSEIDALLNDPRLAKAVRYQLRHFPW